MRCHRISAVKFIAGVVVLACSGQTTGPNAQGISDIVMSPDALTLAVGASASIQARAVNGSGGSVDGVTLFWSSSDSTIATVDQHGTVKAVGLGSVRIEASAAGVSPKHPAQVSVGAVPVASIVVAPKTVALHVGDAFMFTDTTKDAAGNVLSGQTVTWTSSDTAVAPVDQAGLALAKKRGTATITVASGTLSAAATVNVGQVPVAKIVIAPASPTVLVGQKTQLSATTEDAAGNVLTGRTVTWASSDTTTATIDPTGSATGKKAGATTVTATSEGITASTTLAVQAVPTNSVTISPRSSDLRVGQTLTVTAEVTDNTGSPIPGATVAFSSGATGVATVAATGPLTATVTAVSAGQAQITGTSGGKTGSATVNVSPVPVGSVTVAPPTATVTLGGTIQLTATVHDSAGRVLTGRTVTWASLNNGVATVSSTGLVTATGVGATVITAASGGQTGFSTITVVQVPVGSVAITPKQDTLAVNAQKQLAVRVVDSLGHPIANPTVTWISSNNAIAAVSSSGLVLGVAPGTALIIAQSGTKADTNTTTVTSGTPATSVVVAPDTGTIFATAPGNAIDLKATTTPPALAVTWSAGGSTAAAVDQSGHVTATGTSTGSAIITAANGGATGSATITVIGHVGSVTPNPDQRTLSLQGTDNTTITATLLDTFGADVSAQREVTWTSSDYDTIRLNNKKQAVVANPATTAVTLRAKSTNSASVTITATTDDGVAGSVTITVTP